MHLCSFGNFGHGRCRMTCRRPDSSDAKTELVTIDTGSIKSGQDLPSTEVGHTWQSSSRQAHLLELFTSEGCSSCPPAEKRFHALQDDPKLWQTVIPVEFHVDYWDRLGWKDPYAQRAYTARQYDYSAVWGKSSVYTPCAVLDGVEARGDWVHAAKQPGAVVGVLTAECTGDKSFKIRFVPEVPLPHGKELHVFGALVSGEIQSRVQAGENKGRALSHAFVALGLQSAALKANGPNFEGSISLRSEGNFAARHVAFWVTERTSVLQAVGGKL